jgi:hypothetical protein
MSTPTPTTIQPIVKTYRYLRLAMVLLVVMLGVSVGHEWWATGRRCFQDSISAYYFTPVQGVFVGSLTAIGVCMIVIKGNTEWEDTLLNLGGMLLPVVAMVPVPEQGQCRSVPLLLQDVPAKVANNVGALLVTGVLSLAVVVTILVRDRSAERSRAHLVGVLVAASTLLVGTTWFVVGRDSFIERAHYVAAVGMFVCIVVVVVLNARGFRVAHHAARPTRRQFVNRYAVIAGLMVASAAGMGLWAWLFGWAHWLLWVEGTLITLFAAFWLSQTEELWDQGLRGRR